MLKKNKVFSVFFLLNFCIFVGEKISSIIIPIILYEITDNIYSTGLLMMVRFFPRFVSSYIIKKLNECSITHLSILRVSIIVRIAVMVGFLFSSNQWQYYILTFTLYFSSAITYPYTYTIIMKICRSQELPKANNSIALLENISMLLAPICGSMIYQLLNATSVLIIAIVCFLLGLRCTHILNRCLCDEDLMPERRHKTNYKTQTFWGAMLEFNKKMPLIFLLIVVDAVASIAFGSLNTLLPIIVQLNFNNSIVFYSSMNFALSLGLILGNIIFHYIFSTGKNYLKLYITSTILASISFITLGFGENITYYLILLLMIGVCNSIQDASLITEIQLEALDSSFTSFVFSTYQSLVSLIILMTTIFIPCIVVQASTNFIFIILGSINVIGLLILSCKRRIKK